MTSNNYNPLPKWVVQNILVEPPEYHVFENLPELNDFIKIKSLDDWDYQNTYRIFEISITNTFSACIQLKLNLIENENKN
jgi:hypothetical protein